MFHLSFVNLWGGMRGSYLSAICITHVSLVICQFMDVNWIHVLLYTNSEKTIKSRDDKVSPNLFVHPNSPTLIESKPTQLLVGLNGHKPN